MIITSLYDIKFPLKLGYYKVVDHKLDLVNTEYHFPVCIAYKMDSRSETRIYALQRIGLKNFQEMRYGSISSESRKSREIIYRQLWFLYSRD